MSSSTAPIPVLICGKPDELPGVPDLFQRIVAGLKPEYEIVHLCVSAESFLDEFPKAIKGEKYKVSSGIGINATLDKPRVPKAVSVGGAFSEEDYQRMRLVEGNEKVAWARISTNALEIFGPELIGLEDEIMRQWSEQLKNH